jgi:hypothetical protein
MKAEIVERRGCGIDGRIYFRLVSDRRLTRDEIAEAQREAGYHPNGYDGPWAIQDFPLPASNQWVHTWNCAASCD